MTDKTNRDPVVTMNELSIVPAAPNESPEFWLLSPDGDTFPIHINQLHDMMHLLHDLHDQAHHH